MLLLLSFLELTFIFLSNVAALNLTAQSNTSVGQASLVLWAREPSDGKGPLVFDLRFVEPDNKDVGLALANIQASQSSEFGNVHVVFHSLGTYRLVAVSGPDYTRIGQSGQVNVIKAGTTSSAIPTTSSSQSVLSSTSSATATFSASGSGAHRKKNLDAAIGGILAGVAFLGLFAALWIMVLRRRQPTPSQRWSYYRNKIIASPSPDLLDIRRTTLKNSHFSSYEDIEPTRPTSLRNSAFSSYVEIEPTRRMSPMKSLHSSHKEDIEQQKLPHGDNVSISASSSRSRPLSNRKLPPPLAEPPNPL